MARSKKFTEKASPEKEMRPLAPGFPNACLLALVILFVAPSCAHKTPATGTRVHLSRASLAGVHTFAVLVHVEEPFGVKFAQETGRPSPAAQATESATFPLLFAAPLVPLAVGPYMVFTPIGAAIDKRVRASNDGKLTRLLQPQITHFDAKDIVLERTISDLRQAKAFSNVDGLDSSISLREAKSNSDCLLHVTIAEWGLRPCSITTGDLRQQVGLNATIRLYRKSKGEPIWERYVFYLDGDCHPFEEFRTQPQLLTNSLNQALTYFSARIANEIRFAR